MKFYNTKKLIISFAVITLSIVPAMGIESISVEKNAILNIKDCIQLALQNSPAIKKARYNYGLAKNNVTISKSAYFPTIGVGTGYYEIGRASCRERV